jgi:hypothetical protein
VKRLKVLFVVQLFVAAAMIFMGILVAVRPYLLLDVVLTPEQLSEHAAHDATLALMQKATGNNDVWWYIFGSVTAAIALIGLRLSKEAA